MPTTPDLTKACPKCKLVLGVEMFGPDKRSATGLKSWCKSCHRLSSKSRYKLNSDAIKVKNATWRKAHPEAFKTYSKSWRIRNPEKVKALKAEWNLKNAGRVAEQKRTWRESNKEVERLYASIRRARKKANGIFLVTKKDVKSLLSKPCFYCHSIATTIDHVVPIARGGSHCIGNLVPACLPCNLSKGAKLVTEWKMSRIQ